VKARLIQWGVQFALPLFVIPLLMDERRVIIDSCACGSQFSADNLPDGVPDNHA